MPANTVYTPDMFSYVARNIIAPLWAAKEGTPYLKHLKVLQHTPSRTINEVTVDQKRRLAAMLRHAWDNVPFYRKRFQTAGISPDSIRTPEDMSHIPLLTKDDLRSHDGSLFSTRHRQEDLLWAKTSGSTGVSVNVARDEDSQQWKRACAIRHDMWTGWKIGERVGAVWGNPDNLINWRMWLRNLLLVRFTYLDTLKMDEAAMRRFHASLVRKRPAMLFGHAHSLYLFARFMRDNTLSGVHPKGIISTAMVLHDFERQCIEDVFGCLVTNRYGCEEVSLIACECEKHNGMHVNLDTLYVEIVDDDGTPLPAGQEGAVVVTDLTNFGMPFIRYKVGDVGTMLTDPCTCGRSYPLMQVSGGRIADYVRTPSGNYISGISLTENFAMKLPFVKQLQIVQKQLDYILLRIVKGEDWATASPAPEVIIDSLVRDRFGSDMRYGVEYTDHIPPLPSGKYRFCISELDTGTQTTELFSSSNQAADNNLPDLQQPETQQSKSQQPETQIDGQKPQSSKGGAA